METKKFTRLTLENEDRKFTWEVPYSDVASDELLDAMRTLMIGMTFPDSVVLKTMARLSLETLEETNKDAFEKILGSFGYSRDEGFSKDDCEYEC